MRHWLPFLLLALPVTASAGPFDAADAKAGAQIHEKSCVSCHVKMYGGDGSAIYTRKNRIIHSPAALRQRVAACNAQVNAGLFPEDEENVAAYLNEKYYKFK